MERWGTVIGLLKDTEGDVQHVDVRNGGKVCLCVRLRVEIRPWRVILVFLFGWHNEHIGHVLDGRVGGVGRS